MNSRQPRHTQQANAYSAIKWSAASKYASQAIDATVSLVLARLLVPEHFGLMGMATVVIGFTRACTDLGFRMAIVQRKEVDDRLLSTFFWANLAVCGLITLAVAGASPLIASFYGEPIVAPIVAALALTILIQAFALVPAAWLERELDFKRMAVRELGAAVVSGGVGVVCAFSGLGVWSLVTSSLVNVLTRVFLLNALKPIPIHATFDMPQLRQSLSFGLNVTGTHIFTYLTRNADNFIIGAFLGPLALGYYAFAYKIMLLPRETVSQVVSRVLFPKLSRLQDDDERLASIVLRVAAAIAFLVFPMVASIVALAGPLTEFLVGAKWLPAVPLLWILVPLGGLQALWSIPPKIILAKGNGRLFLLTGVLKGVLLVGSFLIGLPWGTVGVASAYAVACLIWFPIWLSLSFRLVEGLRVSDFWRAVSPYLGMSLAVLIAIRLVWQEAAHHTTAFAAISVSLAAGAALYAALALGIRPAAVPVLMNFLPRRMQDALGGVEGPARKSPLQPQPGCSKALNRVGSTTKPPLEEQTLVDNV